ncbi:MAG: hypothetical protein V4443_02200 [Pseudomonadota bacterium]
MTSQNYAGVYNDTDNGLTHLGRMVRDAWVFGILPQTETCEGWDSSRMQTLYDAVYKAWAPYAHLPSRLPDELRARHTAIYAEAIDTARTEGWTGLIEDDD